MKKNDFIPTTIDMCLIDMVLNLDMSDMCLISETWESLSNFNAGVTLYNIRLDKIYIVADFEIAALRDGKMIILKGFKPDQYDREIIDNYFNEE